MKKVICIIPAEGTESWFYKDPGMIIYSLSKYCNYSGTLAYFGKEYHNKEFEKYAKVLSLGNLKNTRKEYIYEVKKFIKKEIKNYDIVMFFNYGSTNYKLAAYCKNYNPNVKVYCKLDMGDGGYTHFYETSISRKIKNHIERFKSKYVDLFTVETLKYYNDLKDNAMFEGRRMRYLTNGVSNLGIDITKMDNIAKKNIVLTVGRLGIYEKNNEMLLEVIAQLPKSLIEQWKFYFVGPKTDSFDIFIEKFFEQHDNLRNYVVFTGPITNREELYTIYSKSKIYCLTSRSEGFNISVLEAMYYGCYPVLSNYGVSAYDVTNDGAIGAICEQGNINEYVNKLQAAILTYSNETALNIKEIARNKYNYQKIAETLDDAISCLK